MAWISGMKEQKVKLAFEFIQVNDGGIIRNIANHSQLVIIVFDAGKKESEQPHGGSALFYREIVEKMFVGASQSLVAP